MADVRELAVLGGGCFWCLEPMFKRLRGVHSVCSGYAGGTLDHPDYTAVCSGRSGHAEVVQISFDPQQISFAVLLDVFFALHDPCTLNRQGHDVGTQYRSVIFWQSEAQKEVAQSVIAHLNASGRLSGPVVTELVPAAIFYAAEDYHQDYFRLHGHEPYCRAVVAPKLAKGCALFANLLQDA